MNNNKIQATETILNALITYIKNEHGFNIKKSKRNDLLVVDSNTDHPAEPYIYFWLDYKRVWSKNNEQYYSDEHINEMPFHIEFGHFNPQKGLVSTQYASDKNIFQMFNIIDEYCNRMKMSSNNLMEEA